MSILRLTNVKLCIEMALSRYPGITMDVAVIVD